NGNPIIENKYATADSETDNGVVSFSFGSGYEMLSRSGLTMNLIGNLDYIQSGIDGYQETGAPGYNLTIEKREESKFTSTINISSTYAISQRNGILIPQFDLAWKHEFVDDTNTIAGAFVSDPVNTGFSFDTLSPDTDYFKARLGIQYLIPGGNTGFASYERTFARSNYEDYNISVGMRGEF
ncbi:MAG: autotransporter outer membrane beta-barrel domain-containing protein, partial [Thiohalomonadales bacterium]